MKSSSQILIRWLVLLCVLSAGAPPAVAAGASCHCFRDRSYDPQDPAAVDPYMLATTQNSLLASVFDIPKQEVVRAKMTGTDDARLWVAHYLAKPLGREANQLLKARDGAENWSESLRALGTELPPLLRAASKPDAELSAAVVDQVLATRLRARPEDLQQLRGAGATDAEVIAAVYLGQRTTRDPTELLERVRNGAVSWGSILNGSGLRPEQIEEDIRRHLL